MRRCPHQDVAIDGSSDNNRVLADTRNKAPVFPDQDTEMEGDQTAQERSDPDENVPENWGRPTQLNWSET